MRANSVGARPEKSAEMPSLLLSTPSHFGLQLLRYSFSFRARQKEILSTLDWNTRWNDQPRYVVSCRSNMAQFLLSVYVEL